MVTRLKKKVPIRKNLMDDPQINDREMAHLIIDNVPSLVSHVGRGGYYRFVNKAYADHFCRPPNKIIGKHLSEIVGKIAYKKTETYVETALSGQRVRFETSIIHKNGETHWIMCDFVPWLDDKGEPDSYFGLFTDITERKIAEEALRKSETKFRSLLKTQEMESLLPITMVRSLM